MLCAIVLKEKTVFQPSQPAADPEVQAGSQDAALDAVVRAARAEAGVAKLLGDAQGRSGAAQAHGSGKDERVLPQERVAGAEEGQRRRLIRREGHGSGQQGGRHQAELLSLHRRDLGPRQGGQGCGIPQQIH